MILKELDGVETIYHPVILVAVLSLVLSSILVPLFIRLSKVFNILDRPSAGSHKTHQQPIPYLGGLAVAIASLLSSSLTVYYGEYSANFEILALVVVLGLGAMALLGLVDDIKPKGAKQRLAIQTLISILVSIFLYELGFVQVQLMASTFLNISICAFLIVSICNFLNMFDNHDGSASGVSLLILLSFFIICLRTNQIYVAILISALIAAILPFLLWNLPPARIYLGDSGATFLGTAIGVVLVSIDFNTLSPSNSILTSFCLIGVLILDFSVAVLSRIRRRISPMTGDKAHTAHRLMRLGLSKKQTTLAVWAITVWFGTHGILTTYTEGLKLLSLYVSACFSLLVFAIFFMHQPDE